MLGSLRTAAQSLLPELSRGDGVCAVCGTGVTLYSETFARRGRGLALPGAARRWLPAFAVPIYAFVYGITPDAFSVENVSLPLP